MFAYKLAHAMQLGMKCVTGEFAPKLINFEQKLRQNRKAKELLNDVNVNPGSLEMIISGHETAVYGRMW